MKYGLIAVIIGLLFVFAGGLLADLTSMNATYITCFFAGVMIIFGGVVCIVESKS